MDFSGIYTPFVTPFLADDTLDEWGLRRNIQRWMQTPLTGLVALGSNGEAPQLDEDESDRVIDIAREEVPAGRPLIAGTGRESTKATIAATKRAAAYGVDAVLVRTPSFFTQQMTTDAFVRHYIEVADASPVPVMLYNVTVFTGVNLQPEAVAALAAHPNIVGLKETGTDLAQMSEYRTRTPASFTLLSGSASTFFHALCAGCDGAVMAIAALVPEECVRLRTLVLDGKLEDARALQRRLLPLSRSVGSMHGVAGVKAALDLLGFSGGYPRPPLRRVTTQTVETIRKQLEALGQHTQVLQVHS